MDDYDCNVPVDSRITLHKLDVFVRVVELGSMSQAADQLYVAQPVVSAHIRSLEERVGAKLFYREGRSVRLTEAGRTVHAWAKDVLLRTDELSRHLDGLMDGSGGSVVIGASMTIGSYSLPPVLARFRKDHPRVDIRMNILVPEHVIAATESGENDFSVVLVRVDPSTTGLVAEVIGSEELALVSAPEYGPRGPRVSVKELAEWAFVEAQRGSWRRRVVDAALDRAGARDRTVAIELGHPEAMKRAVMQSLGIAMLYRSSVQAELDAGVLRELEIEADPDLFRSPVYLVARKDKAFSGVQLQLRDAVSAYFARR